jgi:hypothetical protein
VRQPGRWAAVGLALAVGLGLWTWQRAPAPASGEARAERSAPADSTALPGAEPTPAEADEFRFETLLLPHDGIAAEPASVRIGIGRVPAEEARAHWAWVASGAQGAGPAAFEELARIEEWRSPPARRRDNAVVVVGPLPLPTQGDRFDLQARGASPLVYYSASFTPKRYPAAVRPMLAGGLRVLRPGAAEGEAQLLLRRVEENPQAAAWQPILQREAPRLLAAFDDAPLPVGTDARFAPLPPGPLEAVLQVDGVEAERRRVELVAGAWTEVQFDALPQAVARAVSVDLELELVEAGTRRPVSGVEVTWYADAGDRSVRSDALGRVDFAGVDVQRPQRFNLAIAPGEGELPQWPANLPLELDLEADATGDGDPPQKIRRTVELEPLHWLIVRLGDFPLPFHRQGGDPYPIFVLQRQEDARWRDTAAEHFIRIAEGMAVSLAGAGTYRVMALRAPWSVRHSQAADAGVAGSPSRVFVDLLAAAGRRVEVTVLRDGAPLRNLPVALRGPARGLPEATSMTDAAGTLRLEDVTVDAMQLEVPGFDALEVDLQSQRTTVELVADDDAR